MTGYIWLHLISPQRECRFSPKPYGFLFLTWTCSDFYNIHTNDCNPSITEEMISGIGERSACRDDFGLHVHLMMLVHFKGFIIKSFSVISFIRLDRRMDRLFFASSARPILDHQTKPKKQPWDQTMWNQIPMGYQWSTVTNQLHGRRHHRKLSNRLESHYVGMTRKCRVLCVCIYNCWNFLEFSALWRDFVVVADCCVFLKKGGGGQSGFFINVSPPWNASLLFWIFTPPRSLDKYHNY